MTVSGSLVQVNGEQRSFQGSPTPLRHGEAAAQLHHVGGHLLGGLAESPLDLGEGGVTGADLDGLLHDLLVPDLEKSR